MRRVRWREEGREVFVFLFGKGGGREKIERVRGREEREGGKETQGDEREDFEYK